MTLSDLMRRDWSRSRSLSKRTRLRRSKPSYESVIDQHGTSGLGTAGSTRTGSLVGVMLRGTLSLPRPPEGRSLYKGARDVKAF